MVGEDRVKARCRPRIGEKTKFLTMSDRGEV